MKGFKGKGWWQSSLNTSITLGMYGERVIPVECNKGPRGYHSCKHCFYTRKKHHKTKPCCCGMEECRAKYRYDGRSIYFREMTEEEWNNF